MAIRLITPLEYRNAIERIRRFADGFGAKDGYDLRSIQNDKRYPSSDPRHFEVNLTRGQKQKIRNYFDTLQKHQGYKPVKLQRIKNKKKLKDAQRAMGMPTTQNWRGVFVPVMREDATAKNVHLKQYSGRDQYGQPAKQWVVEYRDLGIDAVYIPFNPQMFAIYGTEYVNGLLSSFDPEFKYNIAFGEGREDWFYGGTARKLIESLNTLIGNYSEFYKFISGIWVYRGANFEEFQILRRGKEKSRAEKRARQEIDKKKVISERGKFERTKKREKKNAAIEKEIERRVAKGILKRLK